jgi:hypothetical protein
MENKRNHNPLGKTWDEIEKERKSTRELALDWWNDLKQEQKVVFWWNHSRTNFTVSKSPKELTGREIEEIWKNEIQVKELRDSYHNAEYLKPNQKQYSQEEVDRLLDQEAARTTAQVLKNNQKQFKEFNPELFKVYIDKFSNEDKFQAFAVLAKHFENHIYGFYKDGDFDRSQNNACYGSFKSRFDTLFNS